MFDGRAGAIARSRFIRTPTPKLVWRFPQPSEYRCSHGRRRGALFVARQEGRHLNRQIADLDGARTLEAPATGNLRTAGAINAQATALAAAAKLSAADDERRQAKRNSLADKLTVEAKALADLKIEKAAVEGERRKVEADLGPVKYLRCSAPRMMTCCATSSSWSPYSSREAPCPRT
jgi:hypothetical protein